MLVAFGADYDRVKAVEFFDRVRAQDVAGLPQIGLLDDRVLNGANGVYVQETDRIYLSRQFVEGSSVDQITGVLIEEIGHSIDARVNAIDAAGDEGNIFSQSVRQEAIGTELLNSLKIEDDHARIILDGRELAVEQAQDFNNDTKVDILWRHSNGVDLTWLMGGDKGNTKIGGQPIRNIADPSWKIRGTGDFNQDGQTDILWWNSTSGQVVAWLMNGPNQVDSKDIGIVSDTRWTILGTGDFNQDGKVDLVWRHQGSGEINIWLMNGVIPTPGKTIGTVDLNWDLQTTGDFNQDGKSDLVWRRNTGEIGVWLMNGLVQSGWAVPGYIQDRNWRIKGAADFNQDGQTDLLWRNYATGQNGVWLMNGATQIDWAPLDTVADLGWEPVVSTMPIYDPTYGYGLVNAAAAVAKAIGQPTFTNVSDVGNSWGNNAINAPEAWAKGYSGQGITIAVIDSGVDINHIEFNNRIWINSREIPNDEIDNDGNGYIDDVNGWDFWDSDNSPLDNDGHGTRVAGIIGSGNNGFGETGVAYSAKIMPVRVATEKGNISSSKYHKAIADGIRYAAENKANIINISLQTIPDNDVDSSADVAIIRDAIRYSVARGCMVVIGAGNEAGGIQPVFPARYATENGVIAVGAVNSYRQFEYSLSNKAGSNSKMHYVVAPGVQIRSTDPGNKFIVQSGTSFATPFVSGIIALMLSANRNLSRDQIWQILSASSETPLV
jgi:subtilisin family serine protease